MKQAIIDSIREYETIIIHRHVRPDPDAYGSQGGLAEMIRASFPEKRVFCAGEDEPSLSWLNRMDPIPEEVFDKALVIVCDTANRERISDNRYSRGRSIIKIDHHPNEESYGDINWVDTTASSTSEMIYELYLEGKKNGFKLTPLAARLLFAGIVGDTGRFLYPSATQKTFRYAGELICYPFSRTELFDQMYEIPLNLAKFEGHVLQNFEFVHEGVAKVLLTRETLIQYGLTANESSVIVSSLGKIKGLLAWAVFVEEEGQIRVRLRSKGPVINEIAKKYNGGGHPLAAGATIETWDQVDSVMADLRAAVEQFQRYR
jgi:DHHA1 domain./DHH family.